jgi:hypothetical protein
MVLVLLVVLTALGGAPCAVLVLVSLASRQEDRARTLTGPAPGMAAAIARRILGFHARGVGRLSEPMPGSRPYESPAPSRTGR